ncbi:MAG: Ig-like domain-containing protein [Myxococcota bacterium]
MRYLLACCAGFALACSSTVRPADAGDAGIIDVEMGPADAGPDLVVDAGADSGTDLGVADLGADAMSDLDFDTTPPVVVFASPPEGSRGVCADATSELRLVFDEPMDFTAARLRPVGGPGSLGAPVVFSSTEVRVPVEGLADATAYRIELMGFEDVAGNPLDGGPLLGDGALDFDTGEETELPVVIWSTPGQGEVGVSASLAEIRLVFSKDMDTSTTPAGFSFSDGTITEELAADGWIDDRTLAIDVVGLVSADFRTYALDLTPSTLGPLLGPSPYLAVPPPGALVFTVGRDRFSPSVFRCTPAEGSVVPATDLIRCEFDEPMLTAGETAMLEDGSVVAGRSTVELERRDGTTRTLTGVWSRADSTFTLNVFGVLEAFESYSLDFSDFRDESGQPLDGSVYLGDGALDFETR